LCVAVPRSRAESLETDLVKRQLLGLPLLLAALTPISPAQSALAKDAAEPATATAPRTTTSTDESLVTALEQVQDLIRTQSQQIETLRKEVDRQHLEIEQLRREAILKPAHEQSADEQQLAAAATAAQLNAGITTFRSSPVESPVLSSAILKPAADSPQVTTSQSADSPLSIHFGKASLTPGGWVDFTAIYRSTDVGSGLGTSFSSIPFNNTVTGGLSETRFTAQGSRVSLRADETFGATRVFGYAEADFNGYLPSNAYVSTNADSLRLRVYFTDVARGRWEVLGGQSWSLLTPNRVGVSPFLSEIYNTLHLDSNYQVGLTYARQTQLRAVAHLSRSVALGLSAENPEQFTGGAATFPALFSTSESDLGSSTGAGGATSTPTLHPDIIAKLSADAGWGDRKWHFETSGLLTPVAIITPASITKASAAKDIREGGGVSGAANLGVAKNLHLILTGFWSDGGGRYIGGLGPGFVVEQRGSKTAPFLAQLVHSGSGIAAAEWQANRVNMVSLTFSQAYFARAFSIDPSSGGLVGYGFKGSANSNNRTLQEGTVATQTTLWKQPGYGSVQVITQSSYITRTPWYVAPGTPKDAHVFAGYANLRYVLP
jgi:hypothetical protein